MAAEPSNSLLVLISAPSGGGKTTLCEQLLATDPNIIRVITCTTRPPREGEQDGVDYYFLDVETFRRRVGAGDFLEHANVHGNHYGTLKSEVLSKLDLGKNVLLSVDVQGAASIRDRAETDLRLKQALVTVFITPPSMKTLEERLKTRGKDSPAIIDRRLSVAREEIAQWKFYDYLIPSTTIREDLRRMEAILIAEKMRQSRAKSPVFD